MRVAVSLLILLFEACSIQTKTGETPSESNTAVDSPLNPSGRDTTLSAFSIGDPVFAMVDVNLMPGKPEGLLGNFVADELYKYIRAVILPKESFCVVLNGEMFKAPLLKGIITQENLRATLPFEDGIVAVKLGAEQMDLVVKKIIQCNGEPVSNIRIKGSSGWSVPNVKFGDSLYMVTTYFKDTGNFIYNDILSIKEKVEIGLNLREVLDLQLQQYQKMNKVISPVLDGRIRL